MVMVKYMLLGFLALIMLFVITVLIVGWYISAPVYRGNVSDHFKGKGFVNPGNIRAKGFKDLLKWGFSRKQGHWESAMDVPYGPKPSHGEEELTITYVNHSTFLIQVDHLNILTDPIWSQRTSPFQWVGPQRMRPPGIRFEDLPAIDLVLISHNHYDHLDKNTIRNLIEKHNPQFVLPLGVGTYISGMDSEKVTEVDWWQEAQLEFPVGIKVTGVPVQHFSGRGMYDRDRTLWVGYIIETGHGTLFFAGDTGYGEMFKEIGRRFPNITVALLPIGAYVPGWFMSPIHISPQEAVQVHLEVGAEMSIAMHFNTFPLGDDGKAQPVEDLKKALQEASISEKDFIIIREGSPLKVQ